MLTKFQEIWPPPSSSCNILGHLQGKERLDTTWKSHPGYIGGPVKQNGSETDFRYQASEFAEIFSEFRACPVQMLGVFLGVALIDSAGRRPLLIWGSVGCGSALFLLFGGVFMGSTTFEVVSMACFMLAFNSSYAGVFWVLVSEMFSMTSKAPAVSAGTAMLFTAGEATTYPLLMLRGLQCR